MAQLVGTQNLQIFCIPALIGFILLCSAVHETNDSFGKAEEEVTAIKDLDKDIRNKKLLLLDDIDKIADQLSPLKNRRLVEDEFNCGEYGCGIYGKEYVTCPDLCNCKTDDVNSQFPCIAATPPQEVDPDDDALAKSMGGIVLNK